MYKGLLESSQPNQLPKIWTIDQTSEFFLRIFCQTKNFPKPLNVLKPSTSYCTSTRQSVCERESKNNISHQWSDNFPWLCSDKVSARSWIVVKWHFTTCEKFVKLCRTQSFFLKILKNLKHQSSSFFPLKSCFFFIIFSKFLSLSATPYTLVTLSPCMGWNE